MLTALLFCIAWKSLAHLQQRPEITSDFGAEDARFYPSAALMLVAALRLMRVSSCSMGCYEPPQRSGMLQRGVHVLRHILAACPATLPVCVTP